MSPPTFPLGAQNFKMDKLEKDPPPKPLSQHLDQPSKHNMQTPYMIMSIEANQAGKLYTAGACLFLWLILAGYLVLPNTFTSLKALSVLSESKGGQILQGTVQNVPLLYVAFAFCFIGLFGISCLWYEWKENYIWLITYIFA
jgi:hypothetical protein